MDTGMGTEKKNTNSSILKKLQRYISLKTGSSGAMSLSKSKSWHSSGTTATKRASTAKGDGEGGAKRQLVAPEGCFTVYVGAEKERFVMKTKYASHPLFKMLLEDAEKEYGYNNQGPILLPCDVDLFCKVLAEMDNSDGKEIHLSRCGSCSPFSPATRRLRNGEMGKGYGSYGILTPSRLLKLNHF